jgi:putative CocE/NonD family hydrolase
MTLAGPAQLRLVAQSTATDTDWVAKLADVAPDGSEQIISSGYLRASHRRIDEDRSSTGSPYHDNEHVEPLQPGVPTHFDVAIYPTAYRLEAGHRLQLRLTTFDVPTHLPGRIRFDRTNPAATEVVPLQPATNTVKEGGENPSWLLVPVLG